LLLDRLKLKAVYQFQSLENREEMNPPKLLEVTEVVNVVERAEQIRDVVLRAFPGDSSLSGGADCLLAAFGSYLDLIVVLRC